MTKIYSKKFTDTFFNTENNLLLTSPYKNNNLFIILTLKDDKITSKVFKYIFDYTEPEIKFCLSIQKNQEIQSALHINIPVEFLLPGRTKNELILVSKNGDIWNAFEQRNTIKLSKRIGKIDFNQVEGNSLDFFEIFDPIDIVAYFTKKTKDFTCLVVKEKDRFYLLLNTRLFSNVSSDNSIIIFEDSTVFWNSIAENLDLFSFNEILGLAPISFPRNKINKEVPISITNLKKFIGNPKDICCINDTLYVITQNHLHIYPNFKRYKTLKSISLPFSPELIWFEPQYKRCKVIYGEGNIVDFVISPTLSEISTMIISIENVSKIKIDEGSGIKSLGNKQFGIIYGDSSSYIWVKKEHISILKTHNLIISELKNPITTALESLQRLKDLKLFDFDQMMSITEAGLPKSLLKLKRRIIRFFTKEEDFFIIEHAYFDLSFPDIAKRLNRTPISIYTHLKIGYGTPTCEKHNKYQKSCKGCAEARTKWVNECKRTIEKKKYRKFTYEEGEISEFDYEEWVRKDRKRRLKKSSSFFSKILPSHMYNNILDFIIDTDLLKGRNINTIFEQCIQIFIDDYLRDSISKEKLVPNHLLEIYFRIQKDMKILKVIIPPYRKLVNRKYRPIGDFNFFFKDLMNLKKLYSPDICDMIRPYLLNLYKNLSKLVIKDGNLAAVLYIISKKINKRCTQAELAEIFLITEVTLRSRMKEIKELMNQGKILEPIREISRIVAENKTIIESIEEEKYQLKIFNRTIKDFVYKQEYQKIPQLITEIEINHLDENLSEISESLELVSRIQDDLTISVLIDFLIESDYFDERIFNNLIKYLGSEDDSIISKVLKLIYHYNPNLESADVYEITETLTKEQNELILRYIKASPFRIKKHNSLKEHIQNVRGFFTAD